MTAFLTKFYGSGGNQSADTPLDTVTCKHRFGLVTANINGEPWQVVDIGMRMLEPRELARAQGFPDSYILEGSKASNSNHKFATTCSNSLDRCPSQQKTEIFCHCLS